jgi:hypothetical protein
MANLPLPKIRLLQVARRQLQLADDDWRALLLRAAGVDSSSTLSAAGFELVMFELERLGFKSTSKRKDYGTRPGFASSAQIGLARKLWREYHGHDPGEAALNTWLTRFHHVSSLRFCTAEKIGSVLAALKQMVARRA